MPVIGSFSTSAQGFLTSRIGPTPSMGADSLISPEQQAEMTQRMFNTKYQENRGTSTFGRIAGYTAGSVIDLVDTVASSVTPGVDRGDVWNFVGDYGGSIGYELEDFYRRNQSGVEAISGISGAVGTAYVGGSLLLPRISSALANTGMIGGSRLWQLGAAANAATRARVLSAQQEAAAAGEAFSVWGTAAGRSYAAMRASQFAGVAAFEEAAIAVTMNTNKMIWSDEMSENLLFAGLGLGIGGALGLGATRYEMRRLANSPEMVKARQEAIDPQGFTFMREHQPDSDWISAAKNAESKESANLTALMLEARQATPATAAPEIVSRFDTFRKQAEEQALSSLQKITSKGVKGVSQTNFRAEGSVGKHLQESLHDDPTALFGLDSLGSLSKVEGRKVAAELVQDAPTVDPILQQARSDFAQFGTDKNKLSAARAAVANTGALGDSLRYQAELERLASEQAKTAAKAKRARAMETPLGVVLTAREDYVEALKATRVTKNAEEARRIESQQPLVLVNKTWLPAETPEAHAISAYQPGRIKIEKVAEGANEFRFRTETDKLVRVNESFEPRIGTGKVRFESLAINDQLQVIEGMNHLFGQMNKSSLAYVLPEKPSWFQVDSALEFARWRGQVDWSKAGIKNAEEAELLSLKLKAEAIGDAPLGDYWNRVKFNLPLPTSTERIYDHAGDSLKAVLEAAQQGADKASLIELRKKMLELNGFDLRGPTPSLAGDIFRFNRDGENKWREIAVGFFDNEKVVKPLTQQGIAEQMAELKAARYHTLTHVAQGETSGLVTDLTRQLHAMPEFQQSMTIRGLADDQITGVGGHAKQLGGEALTREFRYRDNPVMLAATRVRDAVNRLTDERLSQMLKFGFGNVQARLNAASAASSKTLVNQFFSNTSGWDLKRAPVDLGDGKFGFALENTDKNRARLGRDIEEDELLVNPRTDAPIVLDELGLEFAERFNSIARKILRDKNRLRKAMGLTELKDRAWYTPPPNTKGMHIGFTFDEHNNVVPGGAIRAKTRQEFEALRASKVKDLPAGHTFRTREQIEDTADLWDRAAMDWIDPGVGPAPARGQTGSLASDLVNPNAVQDTLEWIKRQMEHIGTNTMRTLYDSQLGIARARGATERAVRGFKKDSPLRTIWDEYEATILGKNLGDMQRSITGQLMHPIENFLDSSIESVWPALRWMAPSQVGNWVGDVMQKAGVKAPKSAKTFSQLAEQLGEYTPYKSAVDYAEQTLKVSRPVEVRNISQQLNKLSASLLLRYFELPHAAMNLIGIITTMPSILRSGKAPVTAVFQGPAGRVGSIDAMKILMGSIKDLTRQSRHADWNYMVRNGDTTQQVAEFNKQMSMVTDRGTFSRVFMGDSSVDPSKVKGFFGKAKATAKQKGIDGLISVATDTSENWSRTWAHFAGLRLADMQGITGLEARHSFAREIANAAIANYNPMNRPELFQSAFGSMAGLFMSWMQSYNQRLFRWMETGEYASIGRQMGMQSALFGVGSMPGYSHVERMLLAMGVGKDEEGNEATMSDHIYAKFGPQVGAALAHGGLQELGVVLYTRGDMNYRDVSLDPSRLAAGIGVTRSAVQAVNEAAQSIFSNSSVDESGRLSEVLARHMPNRVMKGILTMLLNEGQDIDSRGQIVSETKDFFESSVRILGLRSQRQQAEIEAFYANKQMQTREAARMDVLRMETRSLLRTEGWEGRIQEVFDKYLNHGGRPEHFRTWIKDQVRSATSTRGLNDLARAMRNPKTQQEVWRYNAYGGAN